MPLSRRRLLGGAAAAGAGTALGLAVDPRFTPAAAADPVSRGRREVPGPLLDDPEGLLALPRGFRYTVVSRTSPNCMTAGPTFAPGAATASPTSTARTTSRSPLGRSRHRAGR